MKILDHKDAMNRRQHKRLIIVEMAIHRVSCLNFDFIFRVFPEAKENFSNGKS